jgi:hypothetical protein
LIILKLLVEKVELHHDTKTIEATVYWKTSFRQQLIIQRARAAFNQGNIWTHEEDKLLGTLWSNTPFNTILEALPKRTLLAIRNHARHLGLKRQRKANSARARRRWTEQEETQVQSLLNIGTPFSEIAFKLNRSQEAIMQRATSKEWHGLSQAMRKKKPVVWRTIDHNRKSLQEEPSRILSPSKTG